MPHEAASLDIERMSTCQLFQEVYAELKKRAARLMAHERLEHTLSATALVNEAYLRLRACNCRWDSEAHFVCSVARAMQRVLIDRGRAKSTAKRHGIRTNVGVDSLQATSSDLDLLFGEVHELIESLEAVDKLAADLVRLRLFAGLSVIDAGKMLGLTRWSAYQVWTFAQAWFQAQSREQV